MKILRTAVAGLGRIGWQYHIPNIMRHEGFKLVSVADPLAGRLDEAEKEFSVKGYTDYDKMLDAEKPDLVVIASPTIFHTEQAFSAMERGIDVFLEKPMAHTLEEADRMIGAMKSFGRKLMVYQPHRITPEILALKSLLQRNVIGPVYMVKRACSSYVRRNDWQALKKNGGGMLNNYGAHFIDQMMHLADSSAKSVVCRMRRIASLGDADDVVKLLVETNNNILLDIDINMAAAHRIPEWLVLGARGSIAYDRAADGKDFFHVRYYKTEELNELALHTELAASGRNYDNFDRIHWNEEKIPVSDFGGVNFYDKCHDYYAMDQEPFVPVHETREVMRIISECRKDAGWDSGE